MKIEIKERKLTEGKRALYLEYYETGFRKRENLHLYLLPDDAVGAAKHNRLTYNKAMEIRAERILTPPVLEKENAKSEEQGNGLTWLQWCDDYIKWSVDCGNCKKMIGHKNVVRKRIATYLRRVDKKDILLKDVSKDEICGLFDYMRNKYRNKRQIKTNGGRLADYTLLLFEETVKAIFNKAMREGLVKFGSPEKTCGLCVDFCQSEQEKLSIYDATQQSPELFHFCIKGFSRCICRAIDKVVKDFILSVIHSCRYIIEGFIPKFSYFAIP